MSRMYIVNHWSDAAAYSGEQIGDRLKDSTALHFNRDGSANVNLYSEETALAKRKTSVPLKQRILPQASRVDKLRSEAIELEAAFKAGEFSAEEYTLLRSVAFRKLHRAEELLKKAIAPAQKAEEMDEDSVEYAPYSGFSPSPSDGYASEEYVDCCVVFIDSLSETNSLKNILKKACIITRKVIHYKHKISSYLNELKAI